MAGVHPLEDLAPRDVVAAAISRRMAEAPAGVDDHVFLDATHMGERFYDALPVDHRGVPRDRHRPGTRPHPGRPGRALRVRRRAAPTSTARTELPGLLRRRRGRLHRRARRQPAGVATASPRASSPAPGSVATWRGSCPSAVEPDARRTTSRRRRCSTPARAPRGARDDVAPRRRGPRPRRRSPRPPARSAAVAGEVAGRRSRRRGGRGRRRTC